MEVAGLRHPFKRPHKQSKPKRFYYKISNKITITISMSPSLQLIYLTHPMAIFLTMDACEGSMFWSMLLEVDVDRGAAKGNEAV